jgi:MFS family permease
MPAAGSSTRPVPAPRPFFGWRMVSVAFVVDFIAVGFFFYSYGVFLKYLAAEFDGARFGASLGISIANGVGAMVAPFVGRSLDRLPIKRIMITGAFLVSAGFLALSGMTALWQLYLVMGTLLALGMATMGGISSAKLVANWFVHRRGTALGRASVGVSFSGLIMPLAATGLIAWVGWRGSFAIYAALTLLIVVPLVALVVVDRPEEMGLLPDGADPPTDEQRAIAVEERHWRTREMLRDGNFWAIAVPFALAFSCLSAVLIHMFPLATDLGLGDTRAALIPSVAAGAGVLGKIVFGRMVDALDSRFAIWLSLAGQLAGVCMLLAGGGFAWLLAAAAVFGFSMGGVVPLHGAVTAEAFGRSSFGKAMGLLRPVQMPIHLLGVPLAGWIYDVTGSYHVAFEIFAGFYVVAALATFRLRTRPDATVSGREARPA